MVTEAVRGGCRKAKACEALGLSLRTVERWERGAIEDRRRGSRVAPANRLSEDERDQVLAVLNAPVYRDKTVVGLDAALDEGAPAVQTDRPDNILTSTARPRLDT